MRIAYLTCVYPPYPGGIGIAAEGMAHQMAQRGHEVQVFYPFPRFMPHASCLMPHVDKGETKHELGIMKHELWTLFKYGNAAFLPQLLWRLRDFDIIHLCYPFFGVAELVPFLKKLSRAKIVAHHLMDAAAPGILGRVFAWHTKYIAPRIFRAADRVLVLSEDYARNSDVANFGVQWEVVPNGVDTEIFSPKLPTTHYPLPTILFVGGLDRAHYFKGVEVLIKACALLKARGVKFKCQIVGEGELRQEYERKTKVAGLIYGSSASEAPEAELPDIQFVGLVPHEQLPTYYQNATVVVVPSTARVECFSIVAAEAQACGIPVVVSDFPGVRITVEDGMTGFVVPPRDAEALADRLQWMLEHQEQAPIMGAAGRKRAVELYSWKKVGEKLDRIYKGLI